MRYPRPLTAQERAWLDAAIASVPSPRRERLAVQAATVRVHWLCGCGQCHTMDLIDADDSRAPVVCVATVPAGDGREVFLHVDADDRLAELEVV